MSKTTRGDDEDRLPNGNIEETASHYVLLSQKNQQL